MSSSVIISVVCLILIQNLVYTLPAGETLSGQGTSKAPPNLPTTVPKVSDTSEMSVAPKVDKTSMEVSTEKADSESKKPEVKEPGTSTEGPAAPSAQGQDDHKGGSATVFANFGMLIVTASVLMRL